MTDERHDDEVLGRALSRATETQSPNETPYERSRIGTAPARRGFPFWQALGVAAALVLALAFGSWFTRPSDRGPVASSPTPSGAAAASQSPAGTGTAAPASVDPNATTMRVFFVRDILPPVSAKVPAHGSATTPEGRIGLRITAAYDAPNGSVPEGAANPLALVGRITTPTGGSGGLGVSVNVTGDTANVQFDVPNGWGVHGAAQVQGLVQQLVYLITEEPGIRRAHITEKGKTNAIIDGLVVDKPLSREDVTDYDALGSTTTVQGFGDATAAAPRKLRPILNVDTIAPALARLAIEADLEVNSPGVSYPDFKVDVFQNDDSTAQALPGKWRLVVTVNGQSLGFFDTNLTFPQYQAIDKSPVRGIVTSKQGNNTVYEIGLDDLRPWRTAIAFSPFRIIVDIGGDPRMIAASNAVYAPAYGSTVDHSFQVSGIAHSFEANVVIRVRDDKDKEILQTSTTATNCCDPGGTFDKTVQLPASVTGKIYLEVFEASARDGSAVNLIRIPLTVR